MSSDPTTTPPIHDERGPGRPREPDLDARILAATLELLARHGYARLSIDAVAAAAGVTRPTIYRRYANKIELAVSAVIAYCGQIPLHYTGDLRADLIAQMEHFRQALDRPHGMSMLGTMLAEEHDTPELLAVFREYLVQPRRTALRALLQRGQAEGAIRPDAPTELVIQMLIGAYYAQYLEGTPFAPNWSSTLVDTVLPLLTAAPIAPVPSVL